MLLIQGLSLCLMWVSEQVHLVVSTGSPGGQYRFTWWSVQVHPVVSTGSPGGLYRWWYIWYCWKHHLVIPGEVVTDIVCSFDWSLADAVTSVGLLCLYQVGHSSHKKIGNLKKNVTTKSYLCHYVPSLDWAYSHPAFQPVLMLSWKKASKQLKQL